MERRGIAARWSVLLGAKSLISANLNGAFFRNPRQPPPKAVQLSLSFAIIHPHEAVHDLRGQHIKANELKHPCVYGPQNRIDIAVERISNTSRGT